MTEPMQPGPRAESQLVLGPPSEAAVFLVLTIDPRAEPVARDLLADVAGLQRAVGFRGVPGGELSCVVGVGSATWDRLFGGPRPAELHPFRELIGERHHAVSTPGDLLFHIRASRMDPCFELAAQVMDRLACSVTVTDEDAAEPLVMRPSGADSRPLGQTRGESPPRLR